MVRDGGERIDSRNNEEGNVRTSMTFHVRDDGMGGLGAQDDSVLGS